MRTFPWKLAAFVAIALVVPRITNDAAHRRELVLDCTATYATRRRDVGRVEELCTALINPPAKPFGEQFEDVRASVHNT